MYQNVFSVVTLCRRLDAVKHNKVFALRDKNPRFIRCHELKCGTQLLSTWMLWNVMYLKWGCRSLLWNLGWFVETSQYRLEPYVVLINPKMPNYGIPVKLSWHVSEFGITIHQRQHLSSLHQLRILHEVRIHASNSDFIIHFAVTSERHREVHSSKFRSIFIQFAIARRQTTISEIQFTTALNIPKRMSPQILPKC